MIYGFSFYIIDPITRNFLIFINEIPEFEPAPESGLNVFILIGKYHKKNNVIIEKSVKSLPPII